MAPLAPALSARPRAIVPSEKLQPRVSASAPVTPHRWPNINQLIRDLNEEFPGLSLRERLASASPIKRPKHDREFVVDRLIYCVFRHTPEELDSCLNRFRGRIQDPTIHVEQWSSILLKELPAPSRPPNFKPVISRTAPVTSFQAKMGDDVIRSTTPEPDHDDDWQVIEPQSPSAGPNSRIRPRGRKRRSDGDSDNRLPKTSKGSSKDQDTQYDTCPPSPNAASPQLSSQSRLTSALTSFASTAPRGNYVSDDTPFTSFNTDPIGQEPIEPLPQKTSDTFSSWPSLADHLDAAAHALRQSLPLSQDKASNITPLDAMLSNVPPSHRSSTFTGRQARVEQWRTSVTPQVELASFRSSVPYAVKSTTDSETREPLYNMSPSRVLSPMQLRDDLQDPAITNTVQRPTLTTSDASSQLSTLSTQGLFVDGMGTYPVEWAVQWECQRWSSHTGEPVTSFLDCIMRENPNLDDYDQLVGVLRSALPDAKKKLILPLVVKRAWKDRADSCAQYKCKLSFQKIVADSKYLFKMMPTPIFLEKSCRFQRKYGSHRLLYVDIPDLTKMPECFGSPIALPGQVLKWLDVPKSFLGRTWETIHFEQNKAKKHDIERFQGYRAVLLATSGFGLKPLTIESVIDDFMDVTNPTNGGKPFRKLFSRLDLGFSKTIASATFKPSQVKIVDDIYAKHVEGVADPYLDPNTHVIEDQQSSEGKIMTDGCSVMSVAAMREVWKSMGGQGPLPSAMQGRIGGCKGVWTRSGLADSTDEHDLKTWIEVRKSQLKFPFPTTDSDAKFDEHRWTLEISTVITARSQESMQSALHMDMIPLLVDRGVPVGHIEAIMTELFLGQGTQICEVLADSVETRYWIESQDGSSETQRDDRNGGSSDRLPISHSARARLLLESGFEPRHSTYLVDCIEKIAEDYFSRAAKKLSIKLPCSVNMLGVADSLGVLAPNTVHVGFSKSFIDPARDEYINNLHGRAGLVTRFPMQIPSDVQKIRIVYDHRLAHLNDLIVFSTRGSVSLPSKLQGGDLDGDRFILIWDPRLVENFKNAPVALAEHSTDYFGVEKDTRSVGDVLGPAKSVRNFLSEGFRARLKRVPLGQTSNYLSKLAHRMWPNSYNAADNKAIAKLAELYTLLIDADKQGHDYSMENFLAYIQRESDIRSWQKDPDKPEYVKACENRITRQTAAPKGKTWRHPNDYVFFKIVQPRMIEVLNEIHAFRVANLDYKDPQLTLICTKMHTHENEAVRNEDKHLANALQKLRGKWRQAFSQKKNNGVPIENIIDNFCYQYQNISPQDPSLPEVSQSIRWDFQNEPSTWALVKAATLYSLCCNDQSQAFIFQLAAKELIHIKRQYYQHRTIVLPMHGCMKLRKRKLAVILDLEDKGDEEEDVVIVDSDEPSAEMSNNSSNVAYSDARE